MIALEEAKAKYTLFTIDISNKPAWFTELVNPVGKVHRVSQVFPARQSH